MFNSRFRMFQFLMVRLKVENLKQIHMKYQVSIPYGTIKSGHA